MQIARLLLGIKRHPTPIKSVAQKQRAIVHQIFHNPFSTMKIFVALSVFVVLVCAEPPSYRQQNQQQRRYYFARQEEQTTASVPAEAPYPASGWKPEGSAFELPQKQLKDSYAPSREFGSRVEQNYGAPDSQVQDQQKEQQQGSGSLGFQARQQQQQQQFSAFQSQNQQRQYLAPFAYQPQINQYTVPEPQEQFQPPKPDQQYGVPFATTEEPAAAATTTEIEDDTTTSAPQTDSEVEPVNSVNELDEEGDLDDQQVEQQRQQGEYYVALPDGRLQRIQYVSHQDVEAMKYFARIRAENVEPLRGPIYSYAPLRELQFAPAALRIAPNPAVPVASESSSSSVSKKSGKLELEEEAVQSSPPLAAVVQYAYDSPAAVIPLKTGASASYSADYRVNNFSPRYILGF